MRRRQQLLSHDSLRRLLAQLWGVFAITLAIGLVALIGFLGRTVPENSAAHAAGVQVARADVHAEAVLNGKDLELNLAITQTGNDCQAPTNGQVCLRYSILLDEKPIEVGYGLIPASQVTVSASAIVLKTDTRTIPNFVHLAGSGGPITLSWKALTSKSALHTASVQGSMVGHAVPGKGVVAAIQMTQK